MGRNRFVVPGTVRLQLSDGDWIEIKKELNVGDQKRLESAGMKTPVEVNGKVMSPIDWGVYEIERAFIYITDWSFVDSEDKRVPITLDAIRQLDVDTFRETSDGIYEYLKGVVEAKKKKRESEKNPPAPSNASASEAEPVLT